MGMPSTGIKKNDDQFQGINHQGVNNLGAKIFRATGKTSDLVVTLEDHVLPGGYGRIINGLYGDRQITTPVFRIGWPDQFIEHASSVNELREKYGLTAAATISKVEAVLPLKSASASSRSEAVA